MIKFYFTIKSIVYYASKNITISTPSTPTTQKSTSPSQLHTPVSQATFSQHLLKFKTPPLATAPAIHSRPRENRRKTASLCFPSRRSSPLANRFPTSSNRPRVEARGLPPSAASPEEAVPQRKQARLAGSPRGGSARKY